jgi:ribosome-associated protein
MQLDQIDIEALRDCIEFQFDRSAGPGGQNVNKVATRATLWFDVDACAALTDHQKGRVRRQLATRIGKDGRLRVVAQRARTQSGNRAAAEEKLVELIQAALHVAKSRRPTRPTRASRERRVSDKRRRGETKQRRRRPPGAE